MKRFCQIFIFFVFLFTIFFSQTKIANAGAIYNPPNGSVDELTPSVSIQIDNLIRKTQYDICYSSVNCGTPRPDEANVMDKVDTDEKGIIQLIVCGDGDNLVKINDKCSGNDNYFHANKTYGVTLFKASDMSNAGSYSIGNVAVYVPEHITTSPSNPKPGDQLRATIQQDKMRPQGGDRNKYKLILKSSTNSSPNEESDCVAITSPSSQIMLTVPKASGQLNAGSYDLQIQGCGRNQTATYYDIPVAVDQNGGLIGTPSATLQLTPEPTEPSPPPPPCEEGLINPDLPATGGNIVTVLKNPDGSLKNPDQVKLITKCTKVAAAVGGIGTDPAEFITSVFKLLLGISGGIAIILIIASGYRLMASQGNPEQVQGAREMLTSAIVGLLFIIFSFVILQIIGFNILQIPNFK